MNQAAKTALLLFFVFMANAAVSSDTIPGRDARTFKDQVKEGKFAVPQDVAGILKNNTSKIKSFVEKCKELTNSPNIADAHYGARVMHGGTWLPDYYVKYGIKRVENAEKLKKFIETAKLCSLSVAQKYLYHIPGAPEELLDENYLVIAKEVKDGKEEMSAEQAAQLYHLGYEGGLEDIEPSNYIITKNGQLVVIDTEFVTNRYFDPSVALPQPAELQAQRRNALIKEKQALIEQRRTNITEAALNTGCILSLVWGGLSVLSWWQEGQLNRALA